MDCKGQHSVRHSVNHLNPSLNMIVSLLTEWEGRTGKHLDWGHDVHYHMATKFWKLNRTFLPKNEGRKLENYWKDYRKNFFFQMAISVHARTGLHTGIVYFFHKYARGIVRVMWALRNYEERICRWVLFDSDDDVDKLVQIWYSITAKSSGCSRS